MEGVPDLRRVRILDGVMTAKSGLSTTITYEGYYKLLQDTSFHHDKALSEGSRRNHIFTKAKTNLSLHQLIDSGANGGLAGSDMRVLNHTGCKINIVGIDNHELTGLGVVTATSLLDTNQGKVIGMFNEYAFLGKGNSIHSPGLMEYFKTRVDDNSIKVGGKQRLETLEGYAMPIIFKDGLA